MPEENNSIHHSGDALSSNQEVRNSSTKETRESFSKIFLENIDSLGFFDREFIEEQINKHFIGLWKRAESSENIEFAKESIEGNIDTFICSFLDVYKMIENLIKEKELDIDNLPEGWIEKLTDGMVFAYIAHSLQLRASGDIYFTHLVESLKRLIQDVGIYDVDTWVSMLLHDTVEDLDVLFEEGFLEEYIKKNIGVGIYRQIKTVSKMKKISYKNCDNSDELRNIENLNRLKDIIKNILSDLRSLGMKLSDRLHNMETIKNLKPEAQRRISIETLNVYCPLARKFGFIIMERKLAALALKIIDSDKYKEIENMIGGETDGVLKLDKNIKNEIFVSLKDYILDRNSEINIKNNSIEELINFIELSPNIEKKTLLLDLIDMFCKKKEGESIWDFRDYIKSNTYSTEYNDVNVLFEEFMKDTDVLVEFRDSTVYQLVRKNMITEEKQTMVDSFRSFEKENLKLLAPFKVYISTKNKDVEKIIVDKLKHLFIDELLDLKNVDEEEYAYRGMVGKTSFRALLNLVQKSYLLKEEEYKKLLEVFSNGSASYNFIKGNNLKIGFEFMNEEDRSKNLKGNTYGYYKNKPYKASEKIESHILTNIEQADTIEEIVEFFLVDFAGNNIKVRGKDNLINIVPEDYSLFEWACKVSGKLGLHYSHAIVNGMREDNAEYTLQDRDRIKMKSGKDIVKYPEFFTMLKHSDNKLKMRKVLREECDISDFIENGYRFLFEYLKVKNFLTENSSDLLDYFNHENFNLIMDLGIDIKQKIDKGSKEYNLYGDYFDKYMSLISLAYLDLEEIDKTVEILRERSNSKFS